MQPKGVNVTSPTASRSPIPEAISGPKIVAIARGLDPDSLARIADGLLRAGIRAFEVTLTSPRALEAIAGLADRFVGSPLHVGAGTVMDVRAAEGAYAAGARFLVAPNTDVEVIAWSTGRGIPVFPGALTPTEILAAWQAGATAIKLFPVSSLGPLFVREVRAPMSHIPLIPTGGITLETAPDLISSGAVAVGVGSWLTGDGQQRGIATRGAELVRALADPA